MNSVSPPKYDYQAIYGISNEVNTIQGKALFFDLNACRRARHFATKAKLHKTMLALPTATSEAMDDTLHGHRLRRLVGLISLPTAILHDIFSAPYHLAQSRIALSRLSLERKKVEDDVLDEIIESLCTSLETIFKVLVRLGLEMPKSLRRQMQDRRYLLLLTLARLLEAYGSRFAATGTVYLASQKRLPICSSIARLYFDQIHHLKEDLILPVYNRKSTYLMHHRD